MILLDEWSAHCEIIPTARCFVNFFSFLSAAQLDNIGFSIIRKCIYAVETRGIVVHQMALFLGKVLHLFLALSVLTCSFCAQK